MPLPSLLSQSPLSTWWVYVAGNGNGDVKVVNWDEIGDRFVLDVREPGEYAKGHIPGAVNIPLGQLRGSIG